MRAKRGEEGEMVCIIPAAEQHVVKCGAKTFVFEKEIIAPVIGISDRQFNAHASLAMRGGDSNAESSTLT